MLNKILTWTINTRFLRFCLGVKDKRKICKISENSIHFINSDKNGRLEIQVTFENYPKYGGIVSILKLVNAFHAIFTHPFSKATLLPGLVDTINSSAGDGRVIINNATWATARSAASGDATDGFGNVGANLDSGDNTFNIFRGFIPFDTSSIGAGATVTAVTFKLGITSFDDTAGDNSICVILTTQASITVLATGDFDNLTLNTPDEGAARTTFASLSAGVYKEIALNATGIGWVNVTSSTKLGLRSNYDVDNTEPAAAVGSTKNRVRFDTTANAETNPPQLVVTYTAGGAFLSKLGLMSAG